MSKSTTIPKAVFEAAKIQKATIGSDGFGSNKEAEKARHSQVPSKPIVLYEDVRTHRQLLSTDPALERVRVRFQKVLAEKLPANIHESGLIMQYPVTGDFSPILTAAGLTAQPMNYPQPNNHKLLEELGLEDTGYKSERHSAIMESLVRILLLGTDVGMVDPHTYSVSKISQSGFPYFTRNLVYKRQLIKKLLENLDEVLNDIVECFEKDDLRPLADKWDIVLCLSHSMRLQADKAGKTRMVYQKDGQLREVDYKSATSKLGLNNSQACRLRDVFASPLAVTVMSAPYLAPLRDNYLSRYQMTWKHRDKESMGEKAREYSTRETQSGLRVPGAVRVAGVDISNMDKGVMFSIIEDMIDKLCQHSHPGYKLLMQAMFKMPIYVQGLDSSEDPVGREFMGGDPFKPSTWTTEWFLPSGIPPNPDFGKIWCMFIELCGIDDHFDFFSRRQTYFENYEGIPANRSLDVVIDEFLKWKNPYIAIAQMGDDAKFYMGPEASDDDFTKLVKILKDETFSEYAKLGFEKATVFLGLVSMGDADGVYIEERNSLDSYALGLVFSERGVTHANKFTWGLGLLQRREDYSSAGSELDTIDQELEVIWREELEDWPTPYEMANSHYQWAKSQQGFIDLQLRNLNEQERAVLADPSKIHYRDISQVSDRILSSLAINVTHKQLIASNVIHQSDGSVGDKADLYIIGE